MNSAHVEIQTNTSLITMGLMCLIVIILSTAPLWLSEGSINTLTEFFYFLALAQLWNLLAGYAGIVSLGQHAFLGLGGYALFALILLFSVPVWIALIGAGFVGALISIPVAAIVFRLRGAHLAIGTWVIAEVFRLSISLVNVLGAGSGISLPTSVVQSLDTAWIERDNIIYGVALFIGVATNVAAYFFLRSRQGLALTAIRDNEAATNSSGVNSNRIKFMVYVLVAFGTALIGALIYLTKFRISPTAAFDLNWTSYVIFIVVIGGVGTLEGPLVGTLIFFLLREYLADLGSWYLIILGCIAVIVMLKMRDGLWGTFSRRFNIYLFPTHRRLMVPQG